MARLRRAGCVFAEDEAKLLVEAALLIDAADPATLERLVAARESGRPLEQLVGWVAFAGLRLAVGPGVFVPRVRTEWLAEQALRHTPADATVVELCCGVGAVAAVLQRLGRVAELVAVDLDPAAACWARQNLGPEAAVLTGDLYAPLPARLRGTVDVVVANAPYVPSDAIALMPREAREHEPRLALDGGADGADVHRRIIAEAPDWLRAGGTLLIETGREQAAVTDAVARAHGFTVEVSIDDERDATVVVGSLPGQSSVDVR